MTVTDRLYSASHHLDDARVLLAGLGYTDLARSVANVQREVRDLAEEEYEKDVNNLP